MLTYAIDSARKRLDVQIVEATSGPEIQTAIRDILADPAFKPSYTILIDLHGLVSTPTIPELRAIALTVRANAISSGARRAIVTESLLFYGLAELFSILTEGAATRYRAFRSRDEAELWLSASFS